MKLMGDHVCSKIEVIRESYGSHLTIAHGCRAGMTGQLFHTMKEAQL